MLVQIKAVATVAEKLLAQGKVAVLDSGSLASFLGQCAQAQRAQALDYTPSSSEMKHSRLPRDVIAEEQKGWGRKHRVRHAHV